MANINKKQRDFLNQILNNRVSVEAAMDSVAIDAAKLCVWFTQPAFLAEISKRIDCIMKRADMLISQHRLTAVEKLVLLTNCDKEETARKACLDIIELTGETKKDDVDTKMPDISPDTAAKLLEILANGSET